MFLCSYVSEAICAVSALRHFGDYMCCYAPTFRRVPVFLCSYVSEAICAVSVLRHFGDCMCCYAPTFRRLSVLLCSNVVETVLLCPTFRGYLCSYAPTFLRLCAVNMLRHFGDYVLLCSDVSDAMCYNARSFGGYLLLCSEVSGNAAMLRRFELYVMLRRFGNCAYMLRHFGDFMCRYTPTFRKLYCYASTFQTCCYIPAFRRLCCYQGLFVISVSLGQKTGYGEDFRACDNFSAAWAFCTKCNGIPYVA